MESANTKMLLGFTVFRAIRDAETTFTGIRFVSSMDRRRLATGHQYHPVLDTGMNFFSQVTDRFLGESSAETAMPTLLDLLFVASRMQDLLKNQPVRTTIQVAVMAGAIARQMQLSDREVKNIVQAALVYDLGLARIAPEIFSCLPAQICEKQIFRTHSLINVHMLPMPGLPKEEAPDSAPKKTDPEMTAALDALTPLMPPLNGTDARSNPVPLPSPTENSTHKPSVKETVGNRLANMPNVLAQHPLALADFLHVLGLSMDIKAIIEAHHELCDGSGYPYGLTRHQIPVGARILALADTVSAVLIDYARSEQVTSRQQAVENFLAMHSLDRFDPEVILAFKHLMANYPDLLKLANSRDAETLCRNLMPERETPLSGAETLTIAEALADLADNLAPLYRSCHSRKVAHLSLKMAQRLGISKPQCGELVLAALLHDIGMIAIPLGILVKHGSLSEQEWQTVKDHPYWTSEILRQVPQFSNVVLWASEHHERLNGKGYPLAKKGSEISIGGRIIALADVFDALVSLRPYRTHVFEPADALPIILQGRYTQFDNHLAGEFKKLVMESEMAETVKHGSDDLDALAEAMTQEQA